MRRITGFSLNVQRRIFRFQRTVRVDTQDLRNKWITELDELFGMATSIARGKISQQQVGDMLESVTPKERQVWAQVAANIGMVMGHLSKGYDERQVDEDLDELEKMMEEVKKLHADASKQASLVSPAGAGKANGNTES